MGAFRFSRVHGEPGRAVTVPKPFRDSRKLPFLRRAVQESGEIAPTWEISPVKSFSSCRRQGRSTERLRAHEAASPGPTAEATFG
jgi:hypothetical protein